LLLEKLVRVLPILFALAACAPIDEIADAPWDARLGERGRMDLFVPVDATAAAPRPGVLFVHGGGWHGGDKDHHRSEAQRLARSGWITATTNYRLVPEGRFPVAFHDAQCALAFFREVGVARGLDPDRVAVVGMSAGGHLVSLLGVATGHAELVPPDCPTGATAPPDAVVSVAGPQDLRVLAPYDAVQRFVGGTPDEVPHLYDLASPLSHVGDGAPPYLFVHGTFDVFVDIDESRRMRDALVAHGNDARVLSLDAGGHLLNPATDLGRLELEIPSVGPEAWPAIADFLDRTLGAPQ
jgi:acetyl esterase/lipase